MSRLGFENITILWCGVIVATGLLALCGVSLRKSVPPARIGMLIVLRATACLLVVFLLARPFWGESRRNFSAVIASLCSLIAAPACL